MPIAFLFYQITKLEDPSGMPAEGTSPRLNIKNWPSPDIPGASGREKGGADESVSRYLHG